MKSVPYNTGKVKIGEHYVPRIHREMTPEEVFIQRRLLDPKPPLLHRLPLWLYSAALTIFIVSLAAIS